MVLVLLTATSSKILRSRNLGSSATVPRTSTLPEPISALIAWGSPAGETLAKRQAPSNNQSSEAVSISEVENVRAQLPHDIRQLFMVENEGDLPEVDETPTGSTQSPLFSNMGVDVHYPLPPSENYAETE